VALSGSLELDRGHRVTAHPFVQQYRHYLDLLQEVKIANPEMGMQGCNSGGEWANWDKFELIENNQASDGGGPDDLYYLSYFWPIAKMVGGGGGGGVNPFGYVVGSAIAKMAAAAQLAPTGGRAVHQVVPVGEGRTPVGGGGGRGLGNDDARARQEIVLQRFLQKEGVYARYMRVYHPRADGAPTTHSYLEFTNGTRTKAVITPRGQNAPSTPQTPPLAKVEAVVYPKALVPETRYSVAFRFNKEMRTATGAELMKSGIRFSYTDRNEMILLNLDRAPGRGTDHTPRTTPAKAVKKIETWNGRTGVAVRWEPSQDDGLVSDYEVLCDGKLVGHVAIGSFYFDPGASLDQRYEIVAVDGDGNRSPAAAVAL
jgi:hypothetical protein